MVSVDTNPGTNVEINSANPLGKIPALVLDDKTPIFDSNVICEYLDSLKPAPVLFPKSGPERWKTLVLGSLADGILDAALLLVYEKQFRRREVARALATAPAGQDRPCARPAREEPTSLERQPRLRPSHACLCLGTIGSWSKNTAGSTQGGCLVDILWPGRFRWHRENGELAPVFGLLFPVELAERVELDLPQRGLDSRLILGSVVNEDARHGHGEVGGRAHHTCNASRGLAFPVGPTTM